jgi:hypothetical protein
VVSKSSQLEEVGSIQSNQFFLSMRPDRRSQPTVGRPPLPARIALDFRGYEPSQRKTDVLKSAWLYLSLFRLSFRSGLGLLAQGRYFVQSLWGTWQVTRAARHACKSIISGM